MFSSFPLARLPQIPIATFLFFVYSKVTFLPIFVISSQKMRFLNPFPLFLIFIGLSFCTVQSFRLQGVGVKGQLLCKGSYSVHTSVAIFDVDRNPGDPDDLLDETFTDRNGRFVVDGSTRELTNIEPELRIIHDCDDGIKPCHRLLTIKVPAEYIHHGKVDKFFDIGQLDLAQKGENEARTCHLDFHGN